MSDLLLWHDEKSGHTFAVSDEGMSVNGKPVDEAPGWVGDRGPDMAFGPAIPWSGGECPVGEDREVMCIFRGRRPYIGPAIWPGLPKRGRAVMWRHAPAPGRTDPAADIVAFRRRLA